MVPLFFKWLLCPTLFNFRTSQLVLQRKSIAFFCFFGNSILHYSKLCGEITKLQINQQRKSGLEIKEVVISADKIRLRPILMTAICTFFALLPMALALREGEEEMQGLAIGVMGGLTTSTILTLIILPIVYIIFDNLGQRMKTRLRTKLG